MKFRFKHTLAAAIGGLLLSTAPSAEATITFSGGIADLVFYYESADNRWDIVFRNKDNTVATGNTTAYGGFTGIVGGSSDDRTFTDLQINVSSAPLRTVNGINYFITPASGTDYANGTDPDTGVVTIQPDFGIRTRLKEFETTPGDHTTADVQFDNLRLSLNMAQSNLAGDFIMYKFFDTPTFTGNRVLYDTASGDPSDLQHDWDGWGHTHWHFGFSEIGDYSLVFDVEGIGGLYGGNPDTATTQVTLNYSVVPEPSTALLSLLALTALGMRRKRG